MQIDAAILTRTERRLLQQLQRQKMGTATVREARDRLAPTGRIFIIQLVAITVLFLGLGAIFLPFVFIGLAAPFVMLMQQRARTRRWSALLPIERDAEPLALSI